MKAITEKAFKVASDAWGRTTSFHEQYFEVEAADVGTTRQHLGGYNHGYHQFKSSDVGHRIYVQSSPGWTCWSFSGGPVAGNIST